MDNIRNFVITAHVDHGKSTLADRLLEITGTIEKRKMKNQYLDQLELERERGITIKMAPVRMPYLLNGNQYTLNLIDTPGHPDFGYEVSRALEAVEGAVLLVDAGQGIQAQTLSNFYAAKKSGLKIIGAVNKIDLQVHNLEGVISDLANLIGCSPEEIHRVSGKTGEGVDKLLEDIVRIFPCPKKLGKENVSRALVFDSFYDNHKGIIAAIRVFDGNFKEGDEIELLAVGEKLKAKEVGYFSPQLKEEKSIGDGQIGYLVTGLKDPHLVKIGDTVVVLKNTGGNLKSLMLAGYKEPKPVVFVSFFPDDPDEYDDLKKSLEKLKLNDASFAFEPDLNEVLGRGFKGGFLGKLHFEIISQRLEREFGVKTTTSFPSVGYKVQVGSKLLPTFKRDENGFVLITNPKDLPDEFGDILEPMIKIEIVCPQNLLGQIMGLKEIFRWGNMDTQQLSDKMILKTRMPLAELISDFDDRLKSISQGFASFSYEEDGYQKSDLARLDILVAQELVPGLSRILPKGNIEYEARKMASLLKETLPKQQFPQAVQAKVFGRIIARETIPALKKLLGNFGKTGGDRTRKMKLWKKQKEGKKKLLSMAKVRISAENFKKLLSK